MLKFLLLEINQAKEAGIKVIVQLDNQKEQLDRIQDGLTTMRGTLMRAEENLRGLEKCCWICPNPLKIKNPLKK